MCMFYIMLYHPVNCLTRIDYYGGFKPENDYEFFIVLLSNDSHTAIPRDKETFTFH